MRVAERFAAPKSKLKVVACHSVNLLELKCVGKHPKLTEAILCPPIKNFNDPARHGAVRKLLSQTLCDAKTHRTYQIYQLFA